MKIQFVYRPRKSWRWVLIFLFSMWAGIELGATLRADTTHYAPKYWLDTRDPVEDREHQQDRMRKMLYGERSIQVKEETRTTIPDEKQTSSDTQIKEGRQRPLQHSSAESGETRSYAPVVRQSHVRRNHYAADPSTPTQRTLHEKVSGGG